MEVKKIILCMVISFLLLKSFKYLQIIHARVNPTNIEKDRK